MPKLLNINNYHYRRGGSDVVYLEHAALMAENGYENAFFSMRHPKNIPTVWSKFFVDELEFGNSYSAFQKIAMAGKVVYSVEAKKKLSRLLEVFPADIAHMHCIYHHLSPSIIPLLAKAGIPVILTAHDLKIACPAYKMLNEEGICERCNEGSVLNVVRHRCVRNSLSASTIVGVESLVHGLLGTYKRHLSKIVAPSRFFIEKFVEWGWEKERFEYIPNYIDAERFTPVYAPGSYFLYFGRLAPEKGVATLIRAAASSGVKLMIAGTGPEEAKLHRLAAGLGGDIEFVGYQSGGKLVDLIVGARAVVLPSEWYENAPVSILESYALGKPVIAANIGGIPEMLNSETGWLFNSGDANELGEVLAQVASLPETGIAGLGRFCRSRVEEKFSRKRYVDSMLRLYSGLMGSPTRIAVRPSVSSTETVQ